MHHLREYLKQYDKQIYGEIYKIFQSVDYMRDIIRNSENTYQQIEFEALIKEVKNKVVEFTKLFLTLSNN